MSLLRTGSSSSFAPTEQGEEDKVLNRDEIHLKNFEEAIDN